jgi:hypothetical protein
VLSSADCVNDAIARVAELRSAAKPAVPRPSKAQPTALRDAWTRLMTEIATRIPNHLKSTQFYEAINDVEGGVREAAQRLEGVPPGLTDGTFMVHDNESPNFTPPALAELAKRNYERVNVPRTDGAPRACHICGTTTATHSSVCSAAGVPSTWDMGDESAGPNACDGGRK